MNNNKKPATENMSITYDIVEETTDKTVKQLRWNMATGLQKIDNLEPSLYLKELIKENVTGTITSYEVEDALHEYYKTIDLSKSENQKQNEADLTSTRIKQLLDDESFSFRPVELQYIHGYLFNGIYDNAGKVRTYNITKKEPILNNATVSYISFNRIEDTLKYDFEEEKGIDYISLNPTKRIKQIAKFTSAIWQVHAFGDGNTRTIAVFIAKYLTTKGFNVDLSLFEKTSPYFRNALVRSNYENLSKNIKSTNKFLEKYFDNLLNGAKHKLNNKDLYVSGRDKSKNNE